MKSISRRVIANLRPKIKYKELKVIWQFKVSIMTFGNTILAIINFLSYPTWHLVVFYVILLAIVIFLMVKSWFPGYF